MTTPHRTLLQQALDALENSYLSDEHRNYELQAKAITALREALAAPEPEPVAYLVEGWHDGKLIAHIPHLTLEDAKASAAVFSQHYTTTKLAPLYVAPPAAPAEDFCYCNDGISLQMVSGGAASEGLYGRLTLKIDGKYVEYVRAESAAPPAAPAPAAPAAVSAAKDAEIARLRAEMNLQPCGHPESLLLKSAETSEPLYCEACDDKSGRRDAEARETELMAANKALRAEVAGLRAWLEADARCPCCDTTDACVEGCTFATDCPQDAERMAEVRALLAARKGEA